MAEMSRTSIRNALTQALAEETRLEEMLRALDEYNAKGYDISLEYTRNMATDFRGYLIAAIKSHRAFLVHESKHKILGRLKGLRENINKYNEALNLTPN